MKEICKHEVVVRDGFDEGQYGNYYDCLVCGEHLVYPYYQSLDVENRFVISTLGCLTPQRMLVYKTFVNLLLERYKDETINLVQLMQQFQPLIIQIEDTLNEKTEFEKEEMKKKYSMILEKKE